MLSAWQHGWLLHTYCVMKKVTEFYVCVCTCVCIIMCKQKSIHLGKTQTQKIYIQIIRIGAMGLRRLGEIWGWQKKNKTAIKETQGLTIDGKMLGMEECG